MTVTVSSCLYEQTCLCLERSEVENCKHTNHY